MSFLIYLTTSKPHVNLMRSINQTQFHRWGDCHLYSLSHDYEVIEPEQDSIFLVFYSSALWNLATILSTKNKSLSDFCRTAIGLHLRCPKFKISCRILITFFLFAISVLKQQPMGSCPRFIQWKFYFSGLRKV